MRILRDQGPPRSFDEIYAYLEAHLEAHNRVQIVVEEFLDMNAGLESRTPSPTFRQEDLDEDHEPKVKGKGVGKNSKFRPIKASPEDTVGDPDTAGEPQPGPSSGSAAPEAEVDPVVCWEQERHGQLLSMFPDICPDYLMEAVKSAKPPSQEQEPVNIDIASLNTVFATKVDTLLAMRYEERRLLPTRVQWVTKRKTKEELEKWSGNMSVNDMLSLYSDDPAGHFGSEERKPESELYKQHAIESLKHEFRYLIFSHVSNINARRLELQIFRISLMIN